MLAATLFLTAMGLAQTTLKGRGSTAPSSKYQYTLTLFDDSRATLSIIFSRRRRMTAIARWEKPSDDEMILQFVDRAGNPRGEPTIWHKADGKFTPVSWGKKEWDGEPPPVWYRN